MGRSPLSFLLCLATCTGPGMETSLVPAGPVNGKTASAWEPGDVIPGWEGLDVECPLGESAGQAIVWLPDLIDGAFGMTIYEGSNYMGIDVVLADYSDEEDGEVITAPNRGPYVDVDARDYAAESFMSRTGWYGPGTERSDVVLFGAIYVSVGRTNDGGADDVLLCLSRVRPDEMAGVIYVYYHSTLSWLHYDQAVVEYPFEAVFNGGFDSTYELSTPPTDDFWHNAFGYGEGASYDDVWDWDAITDPEIRDIIYERYKPYNWP